MLGVCRRADLQYNRLRIPRQTEGVAAPFLLCVDKREARKEIGVNSAVRRGKGIHAGTLSPRQSVFLSSVTQRFTVKDLQGKDAPLGIFGTVAPHAIMSDVLVGTETTGSSFMFTHSQFAESLRRPLPGPIQRADFTKVRL